MNELALFAGAGGGILGGKLIGWRTVCAVEWEPYPASVLCARQNEGIFPSFPIWDDVQTFDGKPWEGIVDVVSGGFPCQDISSAGKGAGIDGERSGMWREMARIIHEVRPRFVFVENSPMLTSRGLGTVLGDLAKMGFDAKWGVLGANAVGAPHQRERIWIYGSHSSSQRWNNRIADWQERQLLRDKNWDASESKSEREGWFSWVGQVSSDVANAQELFSYGGNDNARICMEREAQSEFGNDCGSRSISNADSTQLKRVCITERVQQKDANIGDPCWWKTEPNVGRMADGVAAGVDRLKAIGNGQVPLCAATAWRILSNT